MLASMSGREGCFGSRVRMRRPATKQTNPEAIAMVRYAQRQDNKEIRAAVAGMITAAPIPEPDIPIPKASDSLCRK